MANLLVEKESLEDIADAIRAKNGSSTTYKPSEMAGAISAIPSGGITPSGSQTFTENGTYDVTSLAEAVVDVETNGEWVPISADDIVQGTSTAVMDEIKASTSKVRYKSHLEVSPRELVKFVAGTNVDQYIWSEYRTNGSFLRDASDGWQGTGMRRVSADCVNITPVFRNSAGADITPEDYDAEFYVFLDPLDVLDILTGESE